MRLDRRERFAVGALVYFSLSSVWIYGVGDNGLLEDTGLLGWSALALVALAHVAFGFVLGERVALLFPIALVLVALPAGYPESRYSEPGPVWFGQVFLALFEIPLIAAGLGLRAFVETRRAAARSS